MSERLGRAVLELVTDPTKLRTGLAAARTETLSTLQATSSALRSIGTQMTATGSQMTRGITVPVVAAGAAIVSVGADFEHTMSEIVGLVGVSRKQVEAWKPEIEALAEATGIGPVALARALYFVTSSGLDAAKAMSVLEMAAKGAEAGMGGVETLASVLTTALASYAKQGLTAADAMDVLTRGIQVGSAEPEDFASALGMIAPIAAQLDVKFTDLVGTLAVLSKVNKNMAEDSTSLGQVFNTLLKPTAATNEALEAMGLTAAQLRDELSTGGVLGVLKLLGDHIGDDDTAIAQIFPNIRALRGVLNLMGQDGAITADAMAKVADRTGALNEAVNAVADDAETKMNKSLASMQVSLIQLGSDVLPVVVNVLQGLAGAVRDAAVWFGQLDPSTRSGVIQFLALAAVVGPLLIVLGSIVGAVGGILGAFTGLYGFLTVSLIPFVAGALSAAWAGFATLLFTTDIPALMALGVAMVGVEIAAAPLLLVLGAIIAVVGGVALVMNHAGSEAGKLEQAEARAETQARRTNKTLEETRRLQGLTADGKAFLSDQTKELTAAEIEAANARDRAAVAAHRASENEDELASRLGPVAYAYKKAADAADEYRTRQRDALSKALADEQKFTSDALAAMRKFRTDMENVFKQAKDAALDASDTALAIAEKSAELAKGDKEYAALKHATALQTAEYKNRRAHILAELAELKLHAALIGTAMQQQTALTALLTGKDMHAGLTSKFPETKLAYESLRDDTLLSLWQLAQGTGPAAQAAAKALQKYLDPSNPDSPLHNAGTWGGHTGAEWAAMLAGAINGSVAPGGVIDRSLDRVASHLRALSPPGPESPLHEIGLWGGRTGEAWVLPFVAAISGARALLVRPLSAIGAALQQGPPSLALAARGLARAAETPAAPHLVRALAATGEHGPLIGSMTVDASGHRDPQAVGEAVRRGVGDAMAQVLRDQSKRLPVGTAT